MNDEPLIFIPWETVLILGRDPLACSEPAAGARFLPLGSQIRVRQNLSALRFDRGEHHDEDGWQRYCSGFRVLGLALARHDERIEINLWRVDLQSFADAHAELIKERDERETGRKFTRQHLAAAVGTAMINRSLTCLRPKVRRQQVHQFVELLRFEEPFPCRRFFLQAVTPLTYGRNYRPQVRILPLIFITTSPMREPVSA